VDCPREAQEKSDQNGKLFERSEFFPFRFFLSIAGSGQSSGSPSFGYFSWRRKKSDSPLGEKKPHDKNQQPHSMSTLTPAPLPLAVEGF
jgi:hypothetical protein